MRDRHLHVAAGEATATRVGIFRIFDAPDDVELVRQVIDAVRGLARRWPGSCAVNLEPGGETRSEWRALGRTPTAAA